MGLEAVNVALNCDLQSFAHPHFDSLLRATSKELSASMQNLLESAPDEEQQALANRIFEKIFSFATVMNAEKYIKACAIGFEKYPLLFINAVRIIRKNELANSKNPKIVMAIAENILFFYKDHIESVLEDIDPSDDIIQDVIFILNATLEEHADKDEFTSVLENFALIIHKKQSLPTNLGNDILKILSLLKKQEDKRVGDVEIDLSKLENNINNIPYYINLIRIFHLNNINVFDSKTIHMIRARSETLCHYLEKCIENCKNFSDENLSELRLGIIYLRKYADVGLKLNTFLKDTNNEQKPLTNLEVGIQEKLNDTLKILSDKYKDVNLLLNSNVYVAEFELLFCLEVSYKNQKININIEMDQSDGNESKCETLIKNARDEDLRQEGISVIRLNNNIQDKLSSKIDAFKNSVDEITRNIEACNIKENGKFSYKYQSVWSRHNPEQTEDESKQNLDSKLTRLGKAIF